MNQLPKPVIDNAIDRIVARLPSEINDLYPSQRMILHQFCLGKNMIYTGNYFGLLFINADFGTLSIIIT